MKVYGQRGDATAQRVQRVSQLGTGRQRDVVDRQSVRPDRQTQQDVVGMRSLLEHQHVRGGVLATCTQLEQERPQDFG